MARRVLIVEHHLHTCMVLYDILLTAGYECLLASDGSKGLEVFRRSQPDLIVTGVEMPFMSGIELLQQVRQQDPDAAVIVLSGGMDETAMTSFKLGAFKVLRKPVNVEELLITAERALARRQFLIERRQHWQTYQQPQGQPLQDSYQMTLEALGSALRALQGLGGPPRGDAPEEHRAVVLPHLNAVGGDATERFRLSIDFTARQALLDFVDLLKQRELLPRALHARSVEAESQMSLSTENYVLLVE
jgi:CheY-like chemotaxis protein